MTVCCHTISIVRLSCCSLSLRMFEFEPEPCELGDVSEEGSERQSIDRVDHVQPLKPRYHSHWQASVIPRRTPECSEPGTSTYLFSDSDADSTEGAPQIMFPISFVHLIRSFPLADCTGEKYV